MIQSNSSVIYDMIGMEKSHTDSQGLLQNVCIPARVLSSLFKLEIRQFHILVFQ